MTQRQQGRTLFVGRESLTTVEMVVDETPTLHSVRVGVRVAWGEKELGRTVRAAGGTWDPAARVWMVTLGLAKKPGSDRQDRFGAGALIWTCPDMDTDGYGGRQLMPFANWLGLSCRYHVRAHNSPS